MNALIFLLRNAIEGVKNQSDLTHILAKDGKLQLPEIKIIMP